MPKHLDLLPGGFLLGSLLGIVALTSVPARAGGGYFSGTKGARAAGRGGAFTARADDLSAVALNPAGLARIGTTVIHGGNRFSYNANAFTRQPTLDWGNARGGVPPYVEFDTVRNQAPWQALDPLFGVATNFGLPDWGFALAAYAPPGIGRKRFPVEGGQRYMMVSRNAYILNYTASAAWKLGDVFGVGATLVWMHVPRLDYEIVIDANVFVGEANPVSSTFDMLAKTSGADLFTFNGILGVWYRPVRFLEIALSGQMIPNQIETESTLDVVPLSSGIEEDVVLERDGQPADDVTLRLPLPMSARFGIRYRHLEGAQERFDIELDVEYESWSRVDRFVLDGDGLVGSLREQPLDIGRIEIEKQWQDTIGVRLGGDWATIPERLGLRGGLFYDSAVAKPAFANVDFVGGHQLGGAVGASVLFAGVEMAVAYEYRHQLPVSITEGQAKFYQEVPGSSCEPPHEDPDLCHPRYLGQPAPAVNAGTYRAHSHVASLDVLYRF